VFSAAAGAGTRVAARRWEVAIRLSLGASRTGLLSSEALAQIVKDTQLALDTRDPITYAVVSLLLISAALAAMLRPAFRAAGSDAAQALRHD